MIETWRDSWFEEGLRVFYVLPRSVTDTVLPITINPTPARLVRVLVGRMEIITPEMEAAVRAEVHQLDSPSTDARRAARAALRSRGRFVEPVLEQVLHGEESGTRTQLIRQVFE